MQHKTSFHNLQYHWLDKQRKPIWINCRGKVIDIDQQSYLVGCINEIGKKQRADNLSGLLSGTTLKKDIVMQMIRIDQDFVLRLGIDDLKEIY